MGFSVSGAAAIIFAGMLIAFGTYHSATTNKFERVTDARKSMTDDALEEANTDIEIQSAVVDDGETRINVTNNGTTSLALNRTDLLVDGTYQTDWQSGATVDGDGETHLWLPGERLSVNVTDPSSPSRVKVVTENGVAARSGVTAT